MTITASGSLSSAAATGTSSLTVVTPTLGYMRILTSGLAGTVAISTVSGGGVGTWTNAVINSDTTNAFRTEIWWGVITSTSTAPTTITLTWASSISAMDCELVSQMFASSLTPTTWVLDVASTHQTTTGTTLTFPTLAPTLGTELYWGYAIVDFTGQAGSTSGFTYDVTPTDTNVVCYDAAVTASVSPTATQNSSGKSDMVGALFAAQSATGAFFM
jgi:hypothetical protein